MMLTIREAATQLGCTPRRVRALCEAGRIVGAQRYSSQWLIPKQIKIDPPLRAYRRKDQEQSTSRNT